MTASMERRLLREFAPRLLLVALPFAAWFAWREVARRTGRAMGSTPWGWLAAAAGVLVGLSLMATALFHEDNRGETYVPGEVTVGGEVTAGHFEKKANAK